MKKIFLFVLLLGMATVGCHTRYLMTLSNGNRITSVGKPKYENGKYRYIDINGQTNYVSASSVQTLEPQPRGYTEEPFKPSKR